MRAASVAIVLAILAPGPAAAAGPGTAMAKASAAYYGALVASARGNTDATNRQLLLLAARWEAAVRDARSAAPPALAGDPAWPAALERATDLLGRARSRARARDVVGAHADLEEMRLLLHEVREKHGLWTLDDHLAEYHEAVERVTGHVSGRSEINFTPADYRDVAEDLAAARSSWSLIERIDGSLRGLRAWRDAARDSGSALQGIAAAVEARDRTALAGASDQLKARYFDLLTAIARARF